MLIYKVIFISSILISIISAFYFIKYYFLYNNLYKNFKSFITFVQDKYFLKTDIIVRNAILEALEQAKEKNNRFEVQAYTKLLEESEGQ